VTQSQSLPLLLFDLDGTLLLTSGAGARAMERAGKAVWGEAFSISSVNFGGSLDPVIVQEAIGLARLEFDHAKHLEFRATYCAELRRELARPDTEAYCLPGILPLLEHLLASRIATVGLLTGNYEETGCQKLTRVGIDPAWFSPRIWGDAAPTRPDLVRVAMQREAHDTPESVIVIGDTARDVHCAKVNGCRVLGVATGPASREELLDAGADHAVDDLTDKTPLLEMIEACSANQGAWR
jgi:phosphoglycolate phosphatase